VDAMRGVAILLNPITLPLAKRLIADSEVSMTKSSCIAKEKT